MFGSAVSSLLAALGLDVVSIGLLLIGVVAMEWGFGVVGSMLTRGITITTKYHSHTYRQV